MEGDTSASRTRIAEKAITSAPSTPARTGLSVTAIETSRGYGAARWIGTPCSGPSCVFFGASIMFAAIRNATSDEGTGLSLGLQLAAGLLLVGAIVVFVRRRR